MNTQQHKHGERVFCWSQSMFGSGSKIWGTVRQCSKYKWVDLDNSVGSNQNRVRYDRAYWYSQDDWDLECQQIREMHENDKRKEEEEKIKAAERYQEVTANLVKLTEIKVGQKIRFVSKYCPDMLDVYSVTEIKNNTIFGLDSDNREVSVGRVGEVYFAVEEPIDNTVVKTVKQAKPKNKVAKLQIKLTRLNAQLSVTKGNRNKAKLVLEILKIELGIEQSEPIQKKPVEVKREIKQSKPVDTPVTKKDEFCKKPDRKTIKLLESRFKDAQIDITETQVILKSETSELTMNCSMELPELDYRRRDVIKSLIRQNQNPKIHSVYEYIGSILLTA